MNKITTFFCAFSFAFAASISLVACGDDSSSASNDEQPGSSSDEIASSSSEGTDLSCNISLGLVEGCESLVEEECTAQNEGEVKEVWVGNPKYGHNTYNRCERGSWVQGDISLTCDTAGVQVGDTCVKQGSSNIFQAGMNPQAGEISFVYKGDGVWERTNQAQIDSLIAKQNRFDAALQEQCGEPDPEKDNQCCFTPPAEVTEKFPWYGSALYEYERDQWLPQAYYSAPDCFEEVIEESLRINNRYSDQLFEKIVSKRKMSKIECFKHIHPQIMPMFRALRELNIKIGLITNCYFEERDVIKNSVFFDYFDAVCMSCELGMKKPQIEIFQRCTSDLAVMPEECLYIGDGGCFELETALSLGMHPIQATWYLKDGVKQPAKRKVGFLQGESPMDVVYEIKKYQE